MHFSLIDLIIRFDRQLVTANSNMKQVELFYIVLVWHLGWLNFITPAFCSSNADSPQTLSLPIVWQSHTGTPKVIQTPSVYEYTFEVQSWQQGNALLDPSMGILVQFSSNSSINQITFRLTGNPPGKFGHWFGGLVIQIQCRCHFDDKTGQFRKIDCKSWQDGIEVSTICSPHILDVTSLMDQFPKTTEHKIFIQQNMISVDGIPVASKKSEATEMFTSATSSIQIFSYVPMSMIKNVQFSYLKPQAGQSMLFLD